MRGKYTHPEEDVMMKTRKKVKKLAKRKPGKGSLIAQLQYVGRQLAAADETICQLSEQTRRDRNEILRLGARETELQDLLNDAVKRLDEEMSAHELARQSATLYKIADEYDNKIIDGLKSDVTQLKQTNDALRVSLDFIKAEALRVIANHRAAGTLLGVMHVVGTPVLVAHKEVLDSAEVFGINPRRISAPLAEMLLSASRKYNKLALPCTDDHLRPFIKKRKSRRCRTR